MKTINYTGINFKYKDVLRNLAQRRYPYVQHWTSHDMSFTCYICGESNLGQKIIEHGYLHLKDKNLLIFI
jgi:hypothetical protein